MRLYRKLAAALWIGLLFALPVRGEIVDQIVAKVNDEIITFSELDRVVGPVYEKYEEAYNGAELFSKLKKAREDALNQLIEGRLLVQEARKLEVRVPEEAIQERVLAVKSRFTSEEEFEKELKKAGLTLEKFREREKEQILVRSLLQREVFEKSRVSPREVRKYYDQHKDEFLEEEKVHAYRILIRKDPENPDNALARAQEVQERLKKGEPFDVVARDVSQDPKAEQGGDWGFIGRGYWPKSLEKAIFDMEVGSTSDPIETAVGYHILCLKARRKPRVKDINEVWKEIEDLLFGKNALKRREEWIEELKKRSYIWVNK